MSVAPVVTLSAMLVAGGLAAGWADPPRSSAWLARLPDGEVKRKFILDCTGCHQFDQKIARPNGKPRTEAEWVEAVTRMLGFAGATTAFPVIAADRDAKTTAAWLARHLGPGEVKDAALPAPARAEITEFMMPEPKDLPHDVAVESSGSVLITGMFTHRLYRLDPATGKLGEIPIPVPNSNPRALELDAEGRAWSVLGMPNKLAVVGADSQWKSFDVGMYPHSLAIGTGGKIWFNGHFTRAPELIGSVDAATGAVVTHEVPPHPTMAAGPGGPIPYEIRMGPDGRVWLSELQGNRVVAFTPATKKFEAFTLPTPHSGPRRLDVDGKGIVWIPAYSANSLVRLDPGSTKFTEIPMPIKDAVPYVVRADPRDDALWIGTAAADVLLRYRPATGRFDSYPLPSRGALVRHLAVDPKSGAVWLAYGASPGIPARVARVLPR
ncbi:MAG: virginiamycin B lyase family protein [Gemmatimonadales bacterium]